MRLVLRAVRVHVHDFRVVLVLVLVFGSNEVSRDARFMLAITALDLVRSIAIFIADGAGFVVVTPILKASCLDLLSLVSAINAILILLGHRRRAE